MKSFPYKNHENIFSFSFNKQNIKNEQQKTTLYNSFVVFFRLFCFYFRKSLLNMVYWQKWWSHDNPIQFYKYFYWVSDVRQNQWVTSDTILTPNTRKLVVWFFYLQHVWKGFCQLWKLEKKENKFHSKITFFKENLWKLPDLNVKPREKCGCSLN